MSWNRLVVLKSPNKSTVFRSKGWFADLRTESDRIEMDRGWVSETGPFGDSSDSENVPGRNKYSFSC